MTGKIKLSLDELVSNYNGDRESQVILTRNSNEIRPLPTRNEGAGVEREVPHKLYNKISESGIVDGWFKYGSKIEVPHGVIYLEDSPKILSQNASMEKIGVL